MLFHSDLTGRMRRDVLIAMLSSWGIFPVLFLIGPKVGGLISESTSVAVHCVGDLIAKNLVGFVSWKLRYEHKKDVVKKEVERSRTEQFYKLSREPTSEQGSFLPVMSNTVSNNSDETIHSAATTVGPSDEALRLLPKHALMQQASMLKQRPSSLDSGSPRNIRFSNQHSFEPNLSPHGGQAIEQSRSLEPDPRQDPTWQQNGSRWKSRSVEPIPSQPRVEFETPRPAPLALSSPNSRVGSRNGSRPGSAPGTPKSQSIRLMEQSAQMALQALASAQHPEANPRDSMALVKKSILTSPSLSQLFNAGDVDAQPKRDNMEPIRDIENPGQARYVQQPQQQQQQQKEVDQEPASPRHLNGPSNLFY